MVVVNESLLYAVAANKQKLYLQQTDTPLSNISSADYATARLVAEYTNHSLAESEYSRRAAALKVEHWGTDNMPRENDDLPICRNVLAWGAKGDGKTDDTVAINRAIRKAMHDVRHCGGVGFTACDPNNTPAAVYIPSGTYLISNSIVLGANTRLTGDVSPLTSYSPPPFVY